MLCLYIILSMLRKIIGTDLEININDALFLDTLLCQIRGETIKFSKKQARENRIHENKLIESIETIEKSIDSNSDLTNRQVLSDYLDSKKEELEQWRETKLNGANDTLEGNNKLPMGENRPAFSLTSKKKTSSINPFLNWSIRMEIHTQTLRKSWRCSTHFTVTYLQQKEQHQLQIQNMTT